ncbi:TM2 domain-containing protein [Mucilaginibacter sp. RS28]|uniref:TM2 domain-containing protein n=1 Tax=Mucilaginibacter straminoryzae TaxID=2932774 RepID=A0A9X1X7S9_9SPHI|nr:TM2 domain-containing protein [Mucilaginibacter straminoryzae]MCJ8211735.1 TM2 domain-containing protein [Mucilaginibacter straminoryzae]
MEINPFTALPNVTFEEANFLQQLTAGLSDSQIRAFYSIYSTRRRSAQDILLFTLLGFILIAGIQRFAIGQIAMGIIYVLTGGFCLIGTIVDLINHKSLANEYNQKIAYESVQIAKMQA